MFEKLKAKSLYNKHWKKIDKLIKKYNPCHRRFENGVFKCRRLDECTLKNGQIDDGCCTFCHHKDKKNGSCKTKCLSCKMWFCHCVWRDEELLQKIKPLVDAIIIANSEVYESGRVPLNIRTSFEETWGTTSRVYTKGRLPWFADYVVEVNSMKNSEEEDEEEVDE